MNNKFHSLDLNKYAFLVTGGAGFIGSHVAEYLLQNGAGKVRVLDNMVNGFESNLNILNQYEAFEFIKGDIRDPDTCHEACKGINFISHQAAIGSVPRSIKDPSYTNEVNVSGFLNILKAAVDNNVSQFVYASSSAVYGDELTLPKREDRIGNSLSPYAVSKRTDELYAKVFSDIHKLPVIGLRYFNIFGPRQDADSPYAAVIPLFIKGIINNQPVFVNGDGEQTRDFTFIENAVQINIKAMFVKDPAALNKVYNVAVGKNFSVNYLYNEIKNYLESDHRATYRQPRQGDIRDSLADISLAKNLLGYRPTKNFDEGLKETIEYFKSLYTFNVAQPAAYYMQSEN